MHESINVEFINLQRDKMVIYCILVQFESINNNEKQDTSRFQDVNKEYGYQNYEDDDEGEMIESYLIFILYCHGNTYAFPIFHNFIT